MEFVRTAEGMDYCQNDERKKYAAKVFGEDDPISLEKLTVTVCNFNVCYSRRVSVETSCRASKLHQRSSGYERLTGDCIWWVLWFGLLGIFSNFKFCGIFLSDNLRSEEGIKTSFLFFLLKSDKLIFKTACCHRSFDKNNDFIELLRKTSRFNLVPSVP